MCGLCGLFGGAEDWSGAAMGRPAGTRRAERLERVRLANEVLAHFGLRLDDWQGSAFLLSGRTGRTEIVDSFSALWMAGMQMNGRPLDPLDPALVARLEGRE